MSATHQDLYSIERAFENAMVAMLQSATKLKVFLEFTNVDKTGQTPFLEVLLNDAGPDEEAAPVSRPDGREDYDRWEGVFVVRVVTSRGKDSDQQAEIVGWVRGKVLEVLGNISPDLNMPLHVVTQIKPGKAPRAHDPDSGFDITALQFPVTIEMKPGSFAM